MGYMWKQEWAIHGSKNGLHVEAAMGHTWKQEWATWKQEWATCRSSNRPYIEARMGHMWKQEWAIYGSKNELHMGTRIGYIVISICRLCMGPVNGHV